MKSQEEGTIGMMQTLITEKERLLSEREELMNIFRGLKVDEVILPPHIMNCLID